MRQNYLFCNSCAVKHKLMHSAKPLLRSICVVGISSMKKIARLLQQVKDIKVKFESRKRNRSLPYHEEQLHRFDR